MTYWTLIVHRWRRFWRSLRQRRLAWLAVLTVGVLGGALALGLTMTGTYLGFFLRRSGFNTTQPVTFLNRHLLFVLLSLFSLRLFFQRTPLLSARAYLSRPISRSRLVRFFLGYSLFSFHNLLPLFFLIPFWKRYVVGSAFTVPGGALFWGTGVLLALLASNYALLIVRGLLERRAEAGILLIGGLIVLISLDTLTGRPLLQRASGAIFGALSAGSVAVLAGFVVLAGAAFERALRTLSASLRSNVSVSPARVHLLPSQVHFTTSRMLNLVLLEIKLLSRNRRPRHYFLLSLLFGTLYLALMLFDHQYFRSILLEAIIGVFASGVFALNYGQLMFAWDSTYFDGLLVRSLTPRAMVRAKLLVLQGSCIFFFLIGLPFFAWLAPSLVPLHLAFLLYNAGVTSVLVLVLALGNERRVVLSRSGGFFNYEGFSLIHWLWVIPTTLPPVLLLYAFEERPAVALIILGGLGALSLLVFPLWSALFARQLRRRRHRMANGFRQRAV